jgi:A/G-specific adenine glycosylase
LLLDWYDEERRELPWRYAPGEAADPYRVWLSEIMLQQTTVKAVIPYFEAFLARWPTVEALAAAPEDDVLAAWAGLGYYARARNMIACAKTVAARPDPTFPQTEAELAELPGIGPYTAAALLSFAFGKPSALVDGNVHRLLSRLMDDATPIDSAATRKRHTDWARVLCDLESPRRHNYAMMELGQTICRPGVPRCEICPVAKFCAAKDPQDLPVKQKRAEITPIEEHAIWSRDEEGRVLLHLESGSRRNGLWKLPLRSGQECASSKLIISDTYTITRYKVTLNIYEAAGNQRREGEEWIPEAQLASLPLAAPFRRAVVRLLADF